MLKMKQELNISFEIIKNREALSKEDQKLYDVAAKARKTAYAPYSNFLVGAALLLENGEIISGNNQENAAFPSSLCAERSAIYWASANFPDVKFKKIFVIGGPRNTVSEKAIPPCGACRQAILEYEAKQNEKIEIFFAPENGSIYKTASIRDLLPFSFDGTFL